MPRFKTCLPAVGCAVLFAAIVATLAAKDHESGARFFDSGEAAELDLPFSEAVRAGDFLYLSGQIGNVPGESAPVPGGIVPESRRALLNMRRVLERHGLTMRDVIKCMVFLTDMAEWAEFNEVYREFFEPPYPARSAVAVDGLALGARVEVECVAFSPR